MTQKQYESFRDYIVESYYGIQERMHHRLQQQEKPRDNLIQLLYLAPIYSYKDTFIIKPKSYMLEYHYALLTTLHMLGIRT